MDSRLYLTIVAVLAVLYGIGFVLFPTQTLELYGVTGQPGAALSIQFFGAALIGIGVISWFAREFKDWDAVRGVLIGYVVYYVVGLLVNFWGTMQGLLNAMAWSSTVLYVLLIVGAVSCLRGGQRR